MLTNGGYGDLLPSTTAGKHFTMFYIFVGIGLILGFVNAVANRSMESSEVGVRRLLERRGKGEGSEVED